MWVYYLTIKKFRKFIPVDLGIIDYFEHRMKPGVFLNFRFPPESVWLSLKSCLEGSKGMIYNYIEEDHAYTLHIKERQ